jgi:hypothetical protein
LRDTVPLPVEKVEPAPDWEKLPLVAISPFSLTLKLTVPSDWRERRVLVAEVFVSLITKAVAVPWLLIVKLESVAVSARLKTIFLLSAVVMELPPA